VVEARQLKLVEIAWLLDRHINADGLAAVFNLDRQ
jgi:hypothetical protein